LSWAALEGHKAVLSSYTVTLHSQQLHTKVSGGTVPESSCSLTVRS
jgi:hypothetical protein